MAYIQRPAFESKKHPTTTPAAASTTPTLRYRANWIARRADVSLTFAATIASLVFQEAAFK